MRKTVFMFSGQGSHYFRMGQDLFEHDPVFRQWMLRLDDLASSLCGERVVDAIYSPRDRETFDRTLQTHPAIFMVEYSLAQSLIQAGLRPDITLGASLGSFAAATLAGFMRVEDALAAVVQQAAAFEACCDRGGMIAVLADQTLYAQPYLREQSELAAINFSSHMVVSAPQAHLAPIERSLGEGEVVYQRLPVSYAFHSQWIDEARAPFESFMSSIRGTPGTLPLASCREATLLTELPNDFFWRVVREPIRFKDTIASLEQRGAHRYIDVGPAGTLATFTKYCLSSDSQSTAHAIMSPFGNERRSMAALLRG
ncbi:acyltransferase domain-containing protein [Steroidobacter agaridevorans]|uniref:acyltransferase domain-containing protein n=1 Tax=Steroidobacter agaridevorans TaxID=2695856 RepID=UPI00132AC376|nr:acyltransferase domain-containing protein [Steroidobacter agaridevorans]GFE86028.1 polyketide biosynthesis acyltransferase PksD [Steroidobacter agaridevorans]